MDFAVGSHVGARRDEGRGQDLCAIANLRAGVNDAVRADADVDAERRRRVHQSGRMNADAGRPARREGEGVSHGMIAGSRRGRLSIAQSRKGNQFESPSQEASAPSNSHFDAARKCAASSN